MNEDFKDVLSVLHEIAGSSFRVPLTREQVSLKVISYRKIEGSIRDFLHKRETLLSSGADFIEMLISFMKHRRPVLFLLLAVRFASHWPIKATNPPSGCVYGVLYDWAEMTRIKRENTGLLIGKLKIGNDRNLYLGNIIPINWW